MTLTEHLHAITNRILDAGEFAYGELFPACNEFYRILVELGGLNNNNRDDVKSIPLDSGKAIGPIWAAMCVKDIMRTKRFMGGIYQATLDKLKASEGRPVHILYTGTGPFAALVLPLTARFSSQQVKFTFLEVNEFSYDKLQKLFTGLGLGEYVHHMELADAAKWQLPRGFEPDIFICETIQLGLKTEPQVAICLNILPQLPKEAVMIPQQITLKAALMKELPDRNNPEAAAPENSMVELETVFKFNKEDMATNGRFNNQPDGTVLFPEIRVALPEHNGPFEPEIYVLTEIVIYQLYSLRINESRLTMPLKLGEYNHGAHGSVGFRYVMGKEPGLKLSLNEITKLKQA